MTQTADILLVEDSKADINLMIEALKDAHVDNDLHVVSESDSVIRFLDGDDQANPKHVRPDLIILDLKMPKKSGLELLKEIKEHDDYKIIPVIVMTSSETNTDIAKAYRYQANSYITKPVNYKKLVEVTELIERYWLETAKLPPK